ncbi:hypothetical protein ATANTOWER_018325, partial [Ataeniobius toweri]|nr:hypothetical protein [Ataeniobius toweri]
HFQATFRNINMTSMTSPQQSQRIRTPSLRVPLCEKPLFFNLLSVSSVLSNNSIKKEKDNLQLLELLILIVFFQPKILICCSSEKWFTDFSMRQRERCAQNLLVPELENS